MPDSMATRHEAGGEDEIYRSWEDSGYFDPDNCLKDGLTSADAPVFSIVLPPPNVTGTLHMGHAEMLVIEDIMIRYHRMRGERTLWLPGTDHAAIATQSKVEKILEKEEGKRKHDLGREEFLKRVDAFAKESHDTIVSQVRKMGSSVDWSREAFTLDEPRSKAVREAFQRMYNAGLIYRGYRVVNWDPKGQTVISDDELVYEERKAKLYTFKYSKDFPISISTTRPETKLGDTAVAVHPEDERYQKFIGQEYDLTFCEEPLHIKIVADASVEKDFGTGALGVTPAHSMVDWEIAQTHNLPLKQVINEYGKMTVGLEGIKDKKTAEAREAVAEWLRSEGLMEKEEEISQNVSTAERTGAIIEPLPKLQWFIAVNKEFVLEHSEIEGLPSGTRTTLKEVMRKAVESKGIEILPERFERVYHHWIDNLRDWCISRQIWYGHRIPVWYCLSCGKEQVQPKVKATWFFVRHGETDWNKEGKFQGQTDIPLNATGREQAEQTAEKLKAYPIGKIISSDLSRAKETAEIIGRALGVSVETDARLRERSFGKAEGMLREEIDQSFTDLFDYYSKDGDAESYEEAEKRIWEVVSEHLDGHTDKNVVFVTHGAVMRALMRKIRNVAPEEFRSIAVPGNSTPIQVDIIQSPCECGNHFFEQDSDTLDTWFSSGLWTFSTLGWPDETEDLRVYHPTSVLETGYDILFFWVARMILMTGFMLGTVPFRTVYLHGLVRDEKGKKMSKSLGNIIDPLDMIGKYGADATRLSLVVGASQGSDIKLSEDRVRGYRNFSTKIWNAARFVLMNRKAEFSSVSPTLTEEDKANLEELRKTREEMTRHIESYDFHLAADLGYHYFWHTFADKVIEAAKPRLSGENQEDAAAAYSTLETILLKSMTMLHPFIPFVTEAVYQEMRKAGAVPADSPALLMVRRWE